MKLYHKTILFSTFFFKKTGKTKKISICIYKYLLKYYFFCYIMNIRKNLGRPKMKKLIKIEEMKCDNCAFKVENALYGLIETEGVDVDLNDKSAKVYLSNDVDNKILTNLINASGHFNVTDIKEIDEA